MPATARPPRRASWFGPTKPAPAYRFSACRPEPPWSMASSSTAAACWRNSTGHSTADRQKTANPTRKFLPACSRLSGRRSAGGPCVASTARPSSRMPTWSAASPTSSPSSRGMRTAAVPSIWSPGVEPRAFSPANGLWFNQSPDGFLVRFIQGENWKLGVGNVVALQARESSSVHVCLVRRVATTSQGGLELGLQVLSPQVSVVNPQCHGEIRRGIYLHRLPGYGNRPGIIARPGHLASGDKVKLNALGDTRLWQIGRRLEASEGLEFFALVPL